MGNSMENMHTDIKVVKVKVESTRPPHKRMQRTYTLKKHYLVIGYSGRITIIILQAKNANTTQHKAQRSRLKFGQLGLKKEGFSQDSVR